MTDDSDDRIATAIAATIGVKTVASTYDDWYAQNAGWAEELPDLSDDDET